MSADPKWVRDTLVEDVLKPAQDEGREVNAKAAEDYVVGVLERLDRKDAEKKAPAAVEKKDATSSEFRKRTGDELSDKWRVDRKQPSKMFVEQDRLRMIGEIRFRERLQWIKARPDLFQKVKGLAAALNSPSASTREHAAMKMREFIEMTNKLAGHDWRKPRPEKLTFG